MAFKNKKNAVKLRLGEYTYLQGITASEQPPVLKVTTKFSLRDPERVKLTKEELLGLASVYVRIYQVPEKNRERLQRWRRAHRRLVQDCHTDFFNSPGEDLRLGISPRKPGVPPEAKAQAQTKVQVISASSENEDDESDMTMDVDEIPSSDSSQGPLATFRFTASQDREQKERLALAPIDANKCIASPNQPAPATQGVEEDDSPLEKLHGELEVARESIKACLIWFQKAAVTVDDRDPLKNEFLEMSSQTAKSFGRASKALKSSRASLYKGREDSPGQVIRQVLEKRAKLVQHERGAPS